MPKKRKSKISNRLQAAQAAHAKFLRKHGIDASKRPSPSGAVASPLRASYTRIPALPETSDTVPGNGSKRDRSFAGTCGLVVGQAYNKGPTMVLHSTDRSALANAKRRDR